MYCPHRIIGKLPRPPPMRLDTQLVVERRATVAGSRNAGVRAGTPYPALRPCVHTRQHVPTLKTMRPEKLAYRKQTNFSRLMPLLRRFRLLERAAGPFVLRLARSAHGS
jgi:hypothetical protein